MIIRDHHGSCLVACRQVFEGIQSPEHAEALALRRAVELARDEGMDKVIFESLSLVQRLNSSSPDRSTVVAGIKQLAVCFSSVSFRHVKCLLNKAAHILAKSCNSLNSNSISYSVPDCIRETLCIHVISAISCPKKKTDPPTCSLLAWSSTRKKELDPRALA